MKSSIFNFKLPEELIAQKPARTREAANLMVLDRKTKNRTLCKFGRIADFLREGDVLVLNDTKVIPARIRAKRRTGGTVELLILNNGRRTGNTRICLVKPLKKIKDGETLLIGEKDRCRLLSRKNGRAEISFGEKPERIMEEYEIGRAHV